MADILTPDIIAKIRFVPIRVAAQIKGKSTQSVHYNIKNGKVYFIRIGDEFRVAVWEREYEDYLRKINHSRGDKYNMPSDAIVALLRNDYADILYSEIRLEDAGADYDTVKNLVEGRVASNLTGSEVVRVDNLKASWDIVINSSNVAFDMKFLKKVNAALGEGLAADAGTVQLSDTSAVVSGIHSILNAEAMTTTDKVVNLVLHLMRNPLFSENNTLTAHLAVNKLMLSGGAGLFVVPGNLLNEFESFFSECTRLKDDEKIVQFIYDNCIMGE